MKTRMLLPLAAAAAVCASGCRTYQYRIVQPPPAHVVAKQSVAIHYDPLDYQLSRSHDRLALRITNPTEDRIVLQGNRSYVVDPKGESHPVRGRVLGPRSYTWMWLPPVPMSYPYPAYAGWGWGWGWGWGYGWGYPWGWGPGWYDPYWGPFYYPPPAYYQVITPFDWTWEEGLARLHLSYDRNNQTFEHNFEIIREQEKD